MLGEARQLDDSREIGKSAMGELRLRAGLDHDRVRVANAEPVHLELGSATDEEAEGEVEVAQSREDQSSASQAAKQGGDAERREAVAKDVDVGVGFSQRGPHPGELGHARDRSTPGGDELAARPASASPRGARDRVTGSTMWATRSPARASAAASSVVWRSAPPVTSGWRS